MREKEIEKFRIELKLRGYSENTIKNYETSVKMLAEFLDENPSQATEDDIKKWLVHLQEKGATPTTIHRHINAIKTFYKVVSNKEINIPLPKLPKRLPKALTLHEIEKLLQAPDNLRDKVILRTLYSTGLRVSELVSLNKEDLQKDRIVVEKGKGNKERIVFIDKQTRNLIEKYLSTRRDNNPALFVNKKGERLSARTVERIVKTAGEKAGIKTKVTPHVIRHTFATHLLKNKADIVVIKDLLGHSNLATTQIYTNLDDEFRKKTYNQAHPLSKK